MKQQRAKFTEVEELEEYLKSQDHQRLTTLIHFINDRLSTIEYNMLNGAASQQKALNLWVKWGKEIPEVYEF